MHDPEFLLSIPSCLTGSGFFPEPMCLFGYVGLGPGPELIPYFLALLSVVGAALIAVLQWPITAFWAYLSRIRRRDDGQPNPERIESPAETPREEVHHLHDE
ncbi:MAG: hypothetical protein ACREHD_09035 [Pirellulales bacterium]